MYLILFLFDEGFYGLAAKSIHMVSNLGRFDSVYEVLKTRRVNSSISKSSKTALLKINKYL
jgi:hypothetical protein